MSCTITDHRRPEQIDPEDTLLVVGTDRILSGWGKAENAVSLAGWVCNDRNQNHVYNLVLRRGDMKRVRLVVLKGYRPRGNCLLSIYPTPPEIIAEFARLDAITAQRS